MFEEVKDILQSLGIREEIEKESILEDDLGIDSLNLFELCVEIEKYFGEDLTNCISAQLTIEQLCEMVDGDRKNSPNTISYDVEQYPMKRRMWDRGILSVFRFLTKVFYKFEVSGTENIPQNGAYIICSNHTSTLDPIWILTAIQKYMNKHDFLTLAAAERAIDSKHFFRILGCIPVDRERGTHPEIARVRKCLREGMNAIIFPEGARSRDGSLLPLKKGVIKIAREAGVSILPIYIEGGFEIFPRHENKPKLFDWHKYRRYPLNVVVKKPLNPSDYDESTMFQQLEKILKGESK